ncbi:short-chain dehydrogenase/reductase SDR [Proteiniborus sp. DW1]|uniref:SDR family oxidoreductase n=1 Tax=Proteiniborus sp. DW1 TaxID=1889883 RepID=UPI00092E0000|nr:SDR family oxidoreductase [Proteiniborus sp. DW1]SCG83152.1 short-chain dehydrogenase/reductase SDR [Proteiniborus sp. DW1]
MTSISYRELFDLKNKTAVVTGGVGILGKKFCDGLSEFGANVVVVDLDKEKVDNFAKELMNKYKNKCLGIACDVSSPRDVKAMTHQVIEEFGEINILHNNAASKSDDLEAFFAPFEEYSLEKWNKIMSVNLGGMFLVAQAIGSHMASQGKGGSIIQTSSIYGMLAPDHRIYEGSYYLNRKINTPAVYSASKAAVIGLSKYLATYWADRNIRVNTLILGGNESGQNETFKNNYSFRTPLGRMGKPDEMVAALVFLASEASSYITGQSIIIDGGLSAW